MGSLRSISRSRGLVSHFQIVKLYDNHRKCFDWSTVPREDKEIARKKIDAHLSSSPYEYYKRLQDIPREYDKHWYCKWWSKQKHWQLTCALGELRYG
jgi:hypothetical protein